MIEKQLAGIVDEQEKGHIIVDPWIPQAIEKKKGFLKSLLSFKKLNLCKRKKKLKADEDLNSTASTNSSSKRGRGIDGHDDEDTQQSNQLTNRQLDEQDDEEEDEDLSNEASVKKIDYIKERHIMIIHSFRKAEIYLMPTELCKKARKIQEIQFDEDPNVYRCFAYNPDQLLFGLGKNALGYLWNENSQIFEEMEPLQTRDQIVQVCGNVQDQQDAQTRNGFVIRNSKNFLALLRFVDGKVVLKGQVLINDNGTTFEKERNFMFYHNSRVILIRWQANYQSEFQKQKKKEKNSESSFSFSSKSLPLKAAVIITIYECNYKNVKDNFFETSSSHRLDLKEFEVIKEIDEAYILPQMQNNRNRIAIVCQNKTFLLVFGYKDGDYILDKAAHNKLKLNFDIKNNIIAGVKENSICEISTFNDSGSYESVIHNSTQSFFHQTQSCIDVQENFLLPFEGDNVVAIEQIELEKGFEYIFLVQEPTEFEDEGDEEEEEDYEGEEEEEEQKSNEVRNRHAKSKQDQDSEDEHDDDCCDPKNSSKDKNSNKQKKNQKQQDKQKDDKKQNKLVNEKGQLKISEKIIFSIYKMKLVTPKEKLRYLISEEMEIEPTMKWFGFNNVIQFKIF